MWAEPTPGAGDSPPPRRRGARSWKRLGRGQGLMASATGPFEKNGLAFSSFGFFLRFYSSCLYQPSVQTEARRCPAILFSTCPGYILCPVYTLSSFKSRNMVFHMLRMQITDRHAHAFVLSLRATAEHPRIHSFFFPREILQQTSSHVYSTVMERGARSPQGWGGAAV